jgi:hypothetical protein
MRALLVSQDRRLCDFLIQNPGLLLFGSEILTDLEEKENEVTGGQLKPTRAKRQIKGKRAKRQR